MKNKFFTKKNLTLILSPVLVTCIGLGIFFGIKNSKNDDNNVINNQYNNFEYSYSKVFLKRRTL